MGMGVNVAGRPVGGPAGVSDADVPKNRPGRQQGFEPIDSASGLHDGQIAGGRDGSHARAVVTAVFEPVQPDQQEFGCVAVSHVPHYPAHGFMILFQA